ncbi:MAG: hypothetical protein Q4E67_03990 [Planctomycetia bacterium]|nr:hypothetical protein [Planctomycetia bacterium]
MRDLEKYDNIQVIRRSPKKPSGDIVTIVMGIFSRLLFLMILLSGIGFLIWYSHRPVDTFTSSYEINRAITAREILRQDAINAEKQLAEGEDEEAVMWKLIQNRQLDPYFPLTQKDRELIRKYWHKVREGLSNAEIKRMLMLLDMKYDIHGNVVDIPPQERPTEVDIETEQHEEVESAIQSLISTSREEQIRQHKANVKKSQEKEKSRLTRKEIKRSVAESLREEVDKMAGPEENLEEVWEQAATEESEADGNSETEPETTPEQE